jgi:hypothetical protein
MRQIDILSLLLDNLPAAANAAAAVLFSPLGLLLLAITVLRLLTGCGSSGVGSGSWHPPQRRYRRRRRRIDW